MSVTGHMLYCLVLHSRVLLAVLYTCEITVSILCSPLLYIFSLECNNNLIQDNDLHATYMNFRKILSWL